MPVPRIGITTERRNSPAGLPLISIPEAYVQAVVQAGGCPVLVPPGISEELLEALLGDLDGLLFTGGGDIEPGRYGAGPHPKIGEVDPDRDRVELHLLRRTLSSGLPFLGVCRGIQLLNAGLGGTLYADIADQHPGAQKHDFFPGWPRDFLAHEIQVAEGSRLAQILGEPILRVNSMHHQGIRDLAPGLVSTAHAPDGLVEAAELPGHPFALAVQWHPECLPGDPKMRALFRAFVETAGSS
jgi:putative glutamine amidotransferase